jgi:catechol 2,3-dioxygenase-like lactoylglutathione lyase family enzyme
MITIEHVAYAAEDTTELAHFYRDVLGFEIVYESAGEPKAYFVQDPNGMAIEVVPPGADGKTTDGVANHLALWVDDFDAAKKQLQAKGVEFEPEAANDFFGGTRIAFFTDPAGHRIQIIWRKQRLPNQR